MRKNILSVLIIAAGIAAAPSLTWAAQGGGGNGGANGGDANAGNPGTPGNPGGAVGTGGANGTNTNPAMPNSPNAGAQPNSTGGAPSALPPGCAHTPTIVNGVQRCD